MQPSSARQEGVIQSLAHLRKGAKGTVDAVSGVGGTDSLGDATGATLARRLVELGFLAGERIEVIEEVRPGRDPIAVRIGSTMFALRRREAQAIMVQVDPVAS
ncbi:MAG TPA: FeoA family protein [Steroidobacteraceae bacterium]|jgi:ferrous iron transport protein A|nr:FeoA family protein [Steroidobacteraceae bacterium]